VPPPSERTADVFGVWLAYFVEGGSEMGKGRLVVCPPGSVLTDEPILQTV
jgi:hypothetical protein